MATERADLARRLDKKKLFEDLGYEPHEGQRAIHESRAPRRVVACGTRWGKSTCAAMEAVAAAMEPAEHSVGWVCAPTYDLASRIFDRIVVVVAGHLRHRIVSLKEHEQRLVLRNMGGGLSEIRGKSSDNPVSLLGERFGQRAHQRAERDTRRLRDRVEPGGLATPAFGVHAEHFGPQILRRADRAAA